MMRLLLSFIFVATSISAYGQSNESATGSHRRISQAQAAGRRIELNSLKGAVLFMPPAAEKRGRLPLIVHFHGAPWLVQYHIALVLPRTALITVQLGAGSS